MFCGHSTKFWGKWLLTLFIGPFMGFLAFALEEFTNKLITWRAAALGHPSGGASMNGWFGFTCWNVVLALVACIACIVVDDPASKGSGIPEVCPESGLDHGAA